LPEIKGEGEVPQQTPRAVITARPSELILPPPIAEEDVTVPIAVVVITGKLGGVGVGVGVGGSLLLQLDATINRKIEIKVFLMSRDIYYKIMKSI
jgi:hypothetical protein